MKKILLMMLMFAPIATFAQKFGHINAQEVMTQMPEFIKARGEMEAKAKQFENDLKAMQDELQRKSQEYDKNKSTMNATKQQETETELNTLYQKYQHTFQGTAGENAAYHNQIGECNQGRWQSWWLCLHHGCKLRHSLHQ